MKHILAIAVLLSFVVTAQADDHVSAAGKFSVWLPDRWPVSESGLHIEAHNPNDSLQVVVGRLKDADADLADEDVLDFIDEEVDDMKVARDETAPNSEGRQTRTVEGTGRDEGDLVKFRLVAFQAGDSVLAALVYGDERLLQREDLARILDRIVRSVRGN